MLVLLAALCLSPPTASPLLYRLADRSGVVWTSPDPAWLRVYVGQRNTSLVPRVSFVRGYQPPAYYGACVNGACVR